MKSVAFFIPSFTIGGVEKTFINYANNLIGVFDVYFIVIHADGELSSLVSKNITIVNMRKSKLRYSLPALVSILKIYRFNFVVSGTEVTNIFAVAANIIAHRPSRIITSQHNYIDIESNKWLYKYLVPWAHRNAYRVLGVSSGICDMLTVQLDISEEKVSLLYNPINVKDIVVQSKIVNSKLPKDYVVFVGRLYPIKNLSLLLKSFALFLEKNPIYSLVIVGDGPEMNDLKSLARSLNIIDRIVFTGEKHNPYCYIANARVLAVSSIVESLSIVVLEALSLGVNVVSTPCCGPEEILRFPKYGFISKSIESPKDFAIELQNAIESPISKEVLMEYAAKFDIGIIIKKFINILS